MSITRKINAVKCMQYMVKTESAHIVKDQDFYQVSKAVKGTELDRQKASSVIETTIRKGAAKWIWKLPVISVTGRKP